jgi:hypothetical protein
LRPDAEIISLDKFLFSSKVAWLLEVWTAKTRAGSLERATPLAVEEHLTMKSGPLGSVLLATLLLFFATSALAQVSVTETSPAPGPYYDGIYISPYYATVNGTTSTPIICDDFIDETGQGSHWNASVTSFSNISGTNTSWGVAQTGQTTPLSPAQVTALYGAVGYLANQLFTQHLSFNQQVIDTYALWAVFDPSGVMSYLNSYSGTSASQTTNLTTAELYAEIFGANGLLAFAESFTNPSQFSNLEVLSPVTAGQICAAGSCPAQEFVAMVPVPEGGTAIGYLLLAGLVCAGALMLKSQRRQRVGLFTS